MVRFKLNHVSKRVHCCYLMYTCQINFALWNVNRVVPCSDKSPEPQITGNKTVLFTGNTHNITCRTEYYWNENITFTWTLGEEKLPGITLPTKYHYTGRYYRRSYPNNVATYTSRLDYNFNGYEKSRHLSCTVHVHNELDGDDSYSVSTDVDLCCK